MNLDGAVRGPVRDTNPEYPPIPQIEQFEQDRRHNYETEHSHGGKLS